MVEGPNYHQDVGCQDILGEGTHPAYVLVGRYSQEYYLPPGTMLGRSTLTPALTEQVEQC